MKTIFMSLIVFYNLSLENVFGSISSITNALGHMPLIVYKLIVFYNLSLENVFGSISFITNALGHMPFIVFYNLFGKRIWVNFFIPFFKFSLLFFIISL